MKRNPLPFLISPHSEIDGKLNDEINVQAAREYAPPPLQPNSDEKYNAARTQEKKQ